jgi:hypothetical protein
MQPGATPGNATQPKRAIGKTNPPSASTAPRQPTDPKQLSPITRFVLKTAAVQTCDAMQPHATGCNATQPNNAAGKTNPPPQISNSQQPPQQPPQQCPTSLTPRQLAAARLIAAGRALPDVALELRLNRSTIWRWTRDPAFQAELRRIHDLWSTPTASPHQRRNPAPPRAPDPLAAYLRSTG